MSVSLTAFLNKIEFSQSVDSCRGCLAEVVKGPTLALRVLSRVEERILTLPDDTFLVLLLFWVANKLSSSSSN